MKRKKILLTFIILTIITILIFLIIFIRNSSNNLKIGNNSTSQEIVDAILNTNFYEAKIEVEVISNKNSNKYLIRQLYNSNNEEMQEVIEPKNIAGVKIIKKDNQLIIKNTKLNLSTFIDKYDFVSENCLDLGSFIKDYKEDEYACWIEENDQIIMKTKNEENKKDLYIDKKTKKPLKLIINRNNKKGEIYIVYNEINLNI